MNIELAIQKNLIINDDNSVYIQLENKYKYIFEQYFLSKVNLLSYENRIDSNSFYIGVGHPNQRQLISNLDNHLNSKYFYIINHFFIEKLDTNDINYLNECQLNDIQALSIIERTYKEIVKDNFIHGNYSNEKYKVNHGVAIPENFADNDSLVIKLFYGRNTEKLEGEEFINNLTKQNEFLKQIKNELIKEITTKLQIPCEIIIEKIPK